MSRLPNMFFAGLVIQPHLQLAPAEVPFKLMASRRGFLIGIVDGYNLFIRTHLGSAAAIPYGWFGSDSRIRRSRKQQGGGNKCFHREFILNGKT